MCCCYTPPRKRCRAFNPPRAVFSRLRLGLESTRPFPLAHGSSLLPSLEMAIRHGAGDAETGFGLEVGAGIRCHDPGRGISRGELQGAPCAPMGRRSSRSRAWPSVGGALCPTTGPGGTLAGRSGGGAPRAHLLPFPNGSFPEATLLSPLLKRTGQDQRRGELPRGSRWSGSLDPFSRETLAGIRVPLERVMVVNPFAPVDNCTLCLQLAPAVPRLVERHSFVVSITRERPTDLNHCAQSGNNSTSILLKTVTKNTIPGHRAMPLSR